MATEAAENWLIIITGMGRGKCLKCASKYVKRVSFCAFLIDFWNELLIYAKLVARVVLG